MALSCLLKIRYSKRILNNLMFLSEFLHSIWGLNGLKNSAFYSIPADLIAVYVNIRLFFRVKSARS